MSAATHCPERRADDTVARWVANTLAEQEADRFATHLLECGRCQEAVRTAAALRGALRDGVVARPGWRARMRVIVPAALAAALVTIWLWPSADPLARLADPGPAPELALVPVRSAQGAPGVAERALEAYAAGDYARAARLLDSVMSVDPTPATRFFLGVSLLKTGKAVEAAAALSPVARDSLDPYAAEAALWLAKAWLGAGLPDSADVVLRSLGGRRVDTGIGAHARALSDSIREARGR